MSETGEYCTRCYGSSGMNHCRDCTVQELGFTWDDVKNIETTLASLVRIGELTNEAVPAEIVEWHNSLAARIQRLLESIQ